MGKKSKNISVYIIIIALFLGSMMQYTLSIYQLIFLSLIIIIFVFEILKLKRNGKENYKIGIIISAGVMVILAGLAIVGKRYIGISDNVQGILLLVGFLEFILALSIFGYRIVIKSGDKTRIRRFVIPMIMVFVLLIFLGLFVLYTLHH